MFKNLQCPVCKKKTANLRTDSDGTERVICGLCEIKRLNDIIKQNRLEREKKPYPVLPLETLFPGLKGLL